MKPVHSHLIRFTLFLFVISAFLYGCDAGKPYNRAKGTPRSNVYSIGAGCATSQDQQQGFNIFFLIEGVSLNEYNSKTDSLRAARSQAPKILSPSERPKVIYDFDPEEIADLKREYNELLTEPVTPENRSELTRKKSQVDRDLFFITAKMNMGYQNQVQELESQERRQESQEQSQKYRDQNAAYLKVTEDFVRAGKKCTVLLISWNLKSEEHPTQDIGPDHGIGESDKDISFNFPKDNRIAFDLPAGKMRLGTQAIVGLPPSDGKCHVLTPQMKFETLEANTSEILTTFIAFTKSSKETNFQEMRWPSAVNTYQDKVFFILPITASKESWIQPFLGAIDSNRFDLYATKFAWKQ